MSEKSGSGRLQREEIQGAPPATSRAELRERRLTESVQLNRYLYLQCQQFEHMLLDSQDLTSLLEILIFNLPRHFSYRVAELWLLDQDGELGELIGGGERFGHSSRALWRLDGRSLRFRLRLVPHRAVCAEHH